MSQQKNQLIIGLFGFGVVGEGLYRVLQQTPGLQAEIRKVCIKHPGKERNAPGNLFTTDPALLLDDPEINVIVELIDDSEAAFLIAQSALQSGKALVSAGKKMIAAHLPELLALQQQWGTPFLYEAACCASIPVIRNLEEYYDNDLLHALRGIVNGSTNYILTRIAEEGLSFSEALKLAQESGFAESDPALDIEGKDAVFKLSILLAHAYGVLSAPEELVHSGIHRLKEADSVFARERGYCIRLLAQATKLSDGRIAAFVLPAFVDKESSFYPVRDEYNALEIGSGLADRQFFSGKGAGAFPTASAVLSDLSALRYGYRYEYKKLAQTVSEEPALSQDFYLRVYVSFKRLHQIPHQIFTRIDEWNSRPDGCSVSGLIHFSVLSHDWWQHEFVSLIVYPEPIIETVAIEPHVVHPVSAEWVAAGRH